MGERTRWWVGAALVAALGGFGAFGCKSTGRGGSGGSEGPPPESTYTEPAATVTDSGSSGGSESVAHDPNTIPIVIDWEGEGEARTATIHLHGATPQTFSPSAEVSEDLVNALKARKTEIAEQGLTPVVKISAPTDVAFDAVVEPIMMASFKAGFGIAEVSYEPRAPK